VRRIRLLLSAILLGVFSAAAVRAQGTSGLHFGVAGGVTLPQGDDDFLENGWHGQVLATWEPPVLPLGLRVDGTYLRMDNNTDRTGEGGGVDVIAGTANVVLGFRLVVVKPYILGGVGYYHLDSSIRSVDGSSFEDTNRPGWNAGVGVSFSLGKVNLFVEGRYHTVDTAGDRFDFVPVSVGLVF
jgi:opacity protein-like surface antigen